MTAARHEGVVKARRTTDASPASIAGQKAELRTGWVATSKGGLFVARERERAQFA